MEEKDTNLIVAEVLPAERVASQAIQGEISAQVATAKAYPRNIKQFQNTALSMATLDEETAASMSYRLERGGKPITGLSVRAAELAAYAWGNLRVETNIESIDDTHVTAVGMVFDSERNIAYRQRVKRRITDKYGKRFKEDMIVVTCNAAASIAFREAVFKAIPRSFLKPIEEAARSVALGDQKTLSERRAKAIDWFIKAGASLDMLLKKLGKHAAQEIDLDDLEKLQGWRTAIRENTTSIDSLFSDEVASEKAQALQEQLLSKKRNMNDGGVWPIPKDDEMPNI